MTALHTLIYRRWKPQLVFNRIENIKNGYWLKIKIRARSPVVEYLACTEESRVQFSAGP